MKSTKKLALPLAIIAIALGGFYAYQSGLVHFDQGALSPEDAAAKLDGLLDHVAWREDIVTQASTVVGQTENLADMLPEIESFPLVVKPSAAGAVVAEIFVSTEKSGEGTDGWMAEAAHAFNGAEKRLKDGRRAKIAIRKIASGTGYQFIGSGKYMPDAFSPSNHLWVRMAEARGVAMTPVRESTVRNVAGIVMKSARAEALEASPGGLTVENIVDAVVRGELATGYTNPFASSTGLNFLVTVLATFARGEETEMLSPEVVSAFEAFQRGIPFVALTTLQMRDSVRQDGSLDAFVMEYQTYIKTKELQSGYEFIPFGLPHDNPLYAVGGPDPETGETLDLFAAFLDSGRFRDLADDYGFNPPITHAAPFEVPGGRTLVEAQKVWKEKKDAGRPIAAVFLSDVSGSMNGSKLRQLKAALLQGSSFIEATNAIGLVEFSDKVTVVLNIKPFGLIHKSAFHSAVQQMQANGDTAMYDGITVALNMLVEETRKNPEVKPLLIVLTDGQTNHGLSFKKVSRVVEGLRIPVYTIGFEANIDELKRLSTLVEAAHLNADEQDVRYKIGSLLNAQM